MKNVIVFIALLLAFTAIGQEESYYQIEMIRLIPDTENIKELSENLAAHNKKYHSKAPYQAAVFNVVTGPDVGDLVWTMGPVTFSELDGRPSDTGHDEDWAFNVVPNLEDVTHGEYWRRNAKRIVNPREPGSAPYPVYFIRYLNVEKGQGYRVGDLLDKIHATLEKTEGVLYWAQYDNWFRQGFETGRHIALVRGLNKWAELDKSLKFVEHFEKLYGEGSFDDFQRAFNEVFSNSWDEIWVLNKKLSGMED